MLRGLIAVLLLVSPFIAKAGQLPLTAKEIGLMLRAGYSNSAVMEELTKRRFLDTVDPDKESSLIKSGASPELIEALEHGKFAVSAQQAPQIQERMETIAER